MNKDKKCDACGEDFIAECTEHINANKDHICDYCNAEYIVHADSDQDHKCDICNETYFENNCKLIVGGKDVSSKYYVHIADMDGQNIALPITAIAKELGAEMTQNEKSGLFGAGFFITLKYGDNEMFFDSDDPMDYTLAGGHFYQYTIRHLVNGEVIFDYNSTKAFLKRLMPVVLEYDKENATVYAYLEE